MGTFCYDSWRKESAGESRRQEPDRGREDGRRRESGGGWRRTQGGEKNEAGAPAVLEGCLGEALRAGATAPSSWQPRRSQTELGKSGELSSQDTHTQFRHRQGPAHMRERKREGWLLRRARKEGASELSNQPQPVQRPWGTRKVEVLEAAAHRWERFLSRATVSGGLRKLFPWACEMAQQVKALVTKLDVKPVFNPRDPRLL